MNNKRWLVLVACLCMGMGAQVVHAKKGFEYTYAEFGLSGVDADHAEGIGFGTGISYAAMDFVHIKMNYDRIFLEVDDLPATAAVEDKVDLNSFEIGVGGNFSITEKIDAVATVSYFDYEFSKDIKDKSEGYMVEAGVRTQPGDKIELDASFIQMDFGSGESDTGFSVGAVYDLKRKLSLTAAVRVFDDEDEVDYFVGLRLAL